MVRKLKQKKYTGGRRSGQCRSIEGGKAFLPHHKAGAHTKASNESSQKQVHNAIVSARQSTANNKNHHYGNQGGGSNSGGITVHKHHCHGNPGPNEAHAVQHVNNQPRKFAGGLKQNKHVNQKPIKIS